MIKKSKLIIGTVLTSITCVGLVKGLGMVGKVKENGNKNAENFLEDVGKKTGESVGRRIDDIIHKYNKSVGSFKGAEKKGEEEIDRVIKNAKNDLDKAAKAAKEMVTA